jgi:hypothetical protein
MLTFGGRATPGVASSAQKKIERLTILDTAHGDAQVTDPGGVAWPEERGPSLTSPPDGEPRRAGGGGFPGA